MTVLAIDTTQDTSMVMLRQYHGNDDIVRDDYIIKADGYRQSEYLISLIDEILGRHHLKLSDVTLLISATGPGSFTGIRIGIATMKGLALAQSLPLIGVNNFDIYHDIFLQSFAQKFLKNSYHIIIIESKRKDFYIRVVKGGEKPIMIEEGCHTPAQIITFIQNIYKNDNQAHFFFSSNAPIPLKIIKQELPYIHPIYHEYDNHNNDVYGEYVSSVLKLGMQAPLNHKKNDDRIKELLGCRPYYLRPPDVTLAKKTS